MRLLLVPLKLRYMILSTPLVGFGVSLALTWFSPENVLRLSVPLVIFGFFSALGLRDFFQPRHCAVGVSRRCAFGRASR
jgi:hypothetical protein